MPNWKAIGVEQSDLDDLPEEQKARVQKLIAAIDSGDKKISEQGEELSEMRSLNQGWLDWKGRAVDPHFNVDEQSGELTIKKEQWEAVRSMHDWLKDLRTPSSTGGSNGQQAQSTALTDEMKSSLFSEIDARFDKRFGEDIKPGLYKEFEDWSSRFAGQVTNAMALGFRLQEYKNQDPKLDLPELLKFAKERGLDDTPPHLEAARDLFTQRRASDEKALAAKAEIGVGAEVRKAASTVSGAPTASPSGNAPGPDSHEVPKTPEAKRKLGLLVAEEALRGERVPAR